MKPAILRILVMIASLGTTTAVGAQAIPKEVTYPVKPVRLVVTFAPGGTTDIQARMLVEKLAPRLGQQILIDNRDRKSVV